MESTSAGRIRFIGRINLLLAACAPLRILNAALLRERRFDPSDWLGAIVAESVLGVLVGHCGWVLLKRLPWAIRETKGTSAAMLGYFACGFATVLHRVSWNTSLSMGRAWGGMSFGAAVHLLGTLGLDGVQCLWWGYCFWSIGLRRPESLPEEERRNMSSLTLIWIAFFVGLVLRAFQFDGDPTVRVRP